MRIGSIIILLVLAILSGINPTQAAAKCDQAPIAVNDRAILVHRHTNIFINVLGNDSDPGHCPIRIVHFTRGERGSTHLHGSGLIFYDYEGIIQPLTDSFTYTIANSAGKTATATVEVLLYQPNLRPPVVQDDYVTNYPGYYQGYDVLNNDVDPDAVGTGLGLRVESIHYDTQQLFASIHKYYPREIVMGAHALGQYTISYTVRSEATGLIATGTLHVEVKLPPPPTVKDDTITVKPGQTVQIDVLKNDTRAITDIPFHIRPQPLSISIDTTRPQPTQGTILLQHIYQYRPDHIVYIAKPDAAGVDVFYYIAHEMFGSSAVGKVTVIIQR